MSYLTPTDLAALQADRNSLLGAPVGYNQAPSANCIVQKPTERTQNGITSYGEPYTTDSVTTAVVLAYDLSVADPYEASYAQQAAARTKATRTLQLPHDTNLLRGWRLIVAGVTYSIDDFEQDATYLLGLIVYGHKVEG